DLKRSYHVAARGFLFYVGKDEPATCAAAHADAWDFSAQDYGGLLRFASHGRRRRRTASIHDSSTDQPRRLLWPRVKCLSSVRMPRESRFREVARDRPANISTRLWCQPWLLSTQDTRSCWRRPTAPSRISIPCRTPRSILTATKPPISVGALSSTITPR